MTATMHHVGPVVQHIARICWKRSVPETAGARFVVSESGDILSPAYAPETMTPTVSGAGMPSPIAMPSSAMPTVPDVPHEVPVASETIEQMTSVAKRNIDGERIDRP